MRCYEMIPIVIVPHLHCANAFLYLTCRSLRSIPLHGLIKMWKTLLFIPFILTGFVAIGYANVTANERWAGINVFTLWNCIPLLLAAITLVPAATRSPQTHRRLRDLWVRIGLAGAILGSMLCVYFTWKFNWWNARTGSSTSGLIFIFAPLGTFCFGLMGLGAGWFAQQLIPNRFHSTRLTDLNQLAISCYVLVGLGFAATISYSGLYGLLANRLL
jgi:hypothetical protein